jgi:hypothetical protein
MNSTQFVEAICKPTTIGDILNVLEDVGLMLSFFARVDVDQESDQYKILLN